MDCLLGAHPGYERRWGAEIGSVPRDDGGTTPPCLVSVGLFAKCADFHAKPPDISRADWSDWQTYDNSPTIAKLGGRKTSCAECDDMKWNSLTVMHVVPHGASASARRLAGDGIAIEKDTSSMVEEDASVEDGGELDDEKDLMLVSDHPSDSADHPTEHPLLALAAFDPLGGGPFSSLEIAHAHKVGLGRLFGRHGLTKMCQEKCPKGPDGMVVETCVIPGELGELCQRSEYEYAAHWWNAMLDTQFQVWVANRLLCWMLL